EAIITLKKQYMDGRVEEFPAEQEFEIGMLEGCLLGKLSTGGTDTNYINGATQPIYFIADSSADSGVVKIRVGLKDSTTGNRSNKGGLQTEAGEYCFLNTFESVIYKDADVKVEKKYEIEIIEPIAGSVEWITEEPKMPEVFCKARLKNYNGGEVTFEWEYWVSYELFRRDRREKNQPWIELCPRTGKVMFYGNSNSSNDEVSTFKVNFSKSNASNIKYTAIQPEIPNWKDYGGNCSEVRNDWNEGEDIFIGGNVWIKVTAKNRFNQILDWDTLSIGELLGGQISKERVLSGIETSFKAIIFNETGYRKYQHFNLTNNGKYRKKGYPLYGYPNGYGLLQIDNNPPPSELQLWNWKENRAAGQFRHKKNIEDAKEYGKRVRNRSYIYPKEREMYTIKIEKEIFVMKYVNATDLTTDEQILKDAFQRYNSGRPYWYWKAEFPNDEFSPGNWEKNHKLKPLPNHDKIYADEVWCIYEQFINGNENPIHCND
ncbi:MAG: hypothetical protein ACK4R9_07595, partial [Ignavibacterium sp.]